ncbi:hypothetical protein [Amycolatopsis tolypomycina]|uniref:hypothetical protein n=1 Tax=Amycolatopsis tolypomycina TaxID=208445 RepID=UPI000A55D47D|nr:hypothetical protein [Amycolatopsis tolypomycina]
MRNDDADPVLARRTALAVLGAGLAAGCSTYGSGPGGTAPASAPAPAPAAPSSAWPGTSRSAAGRCSRTSRWW